MERSIAEVVEQPIEVVADSPIASAWRQVDQPARAATAVALAACVALVVAWWSPVVLATGLTVAVLTMAALVDAVEHRLPDAIVAVAAVPTGVAIAIALAAGEPGVATGAAAGAALLAGPLLAVHLVSPAGMGFGDVKAGFVLGAAIGALDAQLAVLTLLLALAGSGGWAVAHRRRSVALGPGLVAGALASLALAHWIGVD